MRILVTLGIIILILASITLWLVQRSNSVAPSIEVVASQTATTTQKVRFISSQTREVIEVDFSTDVAVLNGKGYQNLRLIKVEAASGARYESTTENVSIWNKGEEVTVYRGRQVMFIGQTEESIGALNPTEEVPTLATTTSISLTGNIWEWQDTTRTDGIALTPNKPGAFTLEFAADGTVRGTTDCNGFSGQYTENGSALESGPFAMTKMFCEGSQEIDFMNLITGANTFSIEEGTPAILTVTGAAGVSRLTQK